MRTNTELWRFGDGLGAEPGELIGYDVEAADGHIGKVDSASEDTDHRYLVVDTGFWILGKKRMVPAGLVSGVHRDGRRVFILMSKDQVKSAPDYDDLPSRYTHDDYDTTFGSYYGGLPLNRQRQAAAPMGRVNTDRSPARRRA